MNTKGGPSAGSGAERRRYVRVPLKLDALIAFDGRPAVPCQVRDFCVAGMFIGVEPERVGRVSERMAATLYFALTVDGKRSDHQMRIVVARVIPAGLGVTFDKPDPAVIQLLQGLAPAPEPEPIPETPEALRQTQERFRPQFAKLLQPLTAVTRAHVEQICGEFLHLADETLFLGARDATSNTIQRKYLDGQNELRGRRERIAHDVPDLVVKGVSILNNPIRRKPEADADPDSSLPELSLLDIDEFEEFLTVSEVVSVLEPKYKEPLHELEKRFSHLANRDIDAHSNPLGPAVICNAFAESLKGFESDRLAINAIYHSLRRTLEAHLPRFFEETNRLLVEHGILPVVEKEKVVIKRPPSADRAQGAPPPSPLESTQAGAFGEAAQPMPPGAGVPGPAPMVAPPGASYGFAPPGTAAGVQPGPYPYGSVTPAAPAVPATAPSPAGAPVMLPLGAGFGVFGSAPVMYAPPSFEQAYATAQAQLALKRELMPETVAAAGTGYYTTNQLIDGLTEIQRRLARTDSLGLLGVDQVRQHIVEAIAGSGGGLQEIGRAEMDAIEVIADLFEALLQDALLSEAAKSHLKRLQAPVHKTALMDQDFFESSDHPVRRLLNRIAQMRPANDAEGVSQDARVGELVRQLNSRFHRDPSVITPVLGELEVILERQRSAYADNVAAIARECEAQQEVLKARREKSLESTDEIQAKTDLPAEWNKWLNRCKALEVGERLIMNANTPNPYRSTLIWIGDDYNPYVFADDKGHKVATLTLQQVAMNLRRGVIKPLQNERSEAVDRALYGVVNRIHEQVEERATHDELTGFMNRKSFVQTVGRHLPEHELGDRGPVLCELTIDNLKAINDEHGVELGDALIEQVSGLLREKLNSKSVFFGRLGGSELGIFWTRGGLKPAYRKMQSCFDSWSEAAIEHDGKRLTPAVSAGITVIRNGATKPEKLLAVAAEACNIARASPDRSIYVAGAEDRQREQLEQIVNYVGKAIERERLVLMNRTIKSLTDESTLPALHVIVTAEDRNAKLIPPDLFMLAVATSERAFDVDRWLLSRTLAWMVDNAEALEQYAAVVIPLTHAALNHEDLARLIVDELMQTPVPPGKICFEVRDQDAVHSIAETTELIRTLREFGCRFVLDEFGSGQQNYDYVKELAVDFVVIQSIFVKEASQNRRDFAMARSINELVHFMGIQTIAKQDAGMDLASTLKEIGVDFIYDLSKTERFVH